jgi:hypothetical protein
VRDVPVTLWVQKEVGAEKSLALFRETKERLNRACERIPIESQKTLLRCITLALTAVSFK